MPERELILRLIGDDSSLRRAFMTSSKGTQKLSKDLSKASRGALAGSGVFRGLGRSIAFASGGFLAFSGASEFLRKSVDAAKEAQVANAQLGVQIRNNGGSFKAYEKQIDATTSRLSALAGIQDDELKAGLVTILRTVPNVTKALADLSLATDLARAKRISLAQASLIIAKVEAGNTTLLRRQGFQIAKNATSEQALAVVRRAVTGQAAAGTTEQERFGAVLHQTEEIIGVGLLPTINRYLITGTKWLQQMNESGKLQQDVAHAAHDVESAVSAASKVIRTADSITGSFAHTLELLVGIKIATKLGGMAENIGLIGKRAEGADGKVKRLKGGLLGLNQVTVAAITIPIVYEITTKILDKTGGTGLLKKLGGKAFDLIHPGGTTALSGASGQQERAALRFARAELDAGKNVKQVTFELINATKFGKLTQDEITSVVNIAKQAKDSLQGVGVSMEQVTAAAEKVAEVTTKGQTSAKRKGLTADQRNTFFDNAVDRILRRGNFGNLQQQLSAIDRATAAIRARLAATKDLTRRLNLQDELLDLGSQRKSILEQIASNARSAAEAKKQAADDAAATKLAQRTAHQFRELGLSATGDPITPGVTNLKKRVGQISKNIAGTKLDTPALRAQLARFRKVLAEGLVPKDVRAKIKDMLDGISEEIKNQKPLGTQFHKQNVRALLRAAGLDPDEVRTVSAALSRVGQGGTVPGSGQGAFGMVATTVNTNINIDGKKVAQSTTKHQQTRNRRNPPQKRGPFRGPH